MARILVIDDEPQMRAMINQMLTRAGHTVEEAPDGNHGARLYRADPADLIITDIIMPDKEGLETIRELKHDYPEVRIIAISGGGRSGTLNFLAAAKAFGANRTLAKPFTRQELMGAVDEVLSA